MRAAGADVSDSQSLALIREADLNSDGRLSLAEFERLASKLPAAPQLSAVTMPARQPPATAAPAGGAGRTIGTAAARPSTARATARRPTSERF